MPGKKYSTEFKLRVVKDYLKGLEGTKLIAKKYQISQGDVQKWRDAYLNHGEQGLDTTLKTYAGEFKIAVVEYMYKTSSSARQTAAHFNIPTHTTVCKWKRSYYEEGKKALFFSHRGRRKHMKKSNNKYILGQNKPTNETLLEEVQRLRMENDYLKKLNALVQEREKSQKPTK